MNLRTTAGLVRGRARQYGMPVALVLLGLLSIGMVFGAYHINQQQNVKFEHADAVMDLQKETATFHLWFEVEFAEGHYEAMDKIRPNIVAALELSRALLDGGRSERDTPLLPLRSRFFRQQAEIIAALVVKLNELASQRLANPEAAGMGSPLHEQFNAVFRQLQDAARTLETLIEQDIADDQASTKRLLLAIVLMWTAVVAVSAVGLYSRERRRWQAELALGRAHAEMEQRVLARTAELAQANRQLQEEIAERRRTEDSLRQSETGFKTVSMQLRTLLDSIPDRITLLSRDLKVLWANRGAGVLAGAGDEREAESCHTFWQHRPLPCNGCPAVTSFSTGQVESARVATPDGKRWEVRTVPIVRDDGAVENVLEVAMDITEKVRLQAETMRAAHLASIGELAAGVAHEINSPINGIINYAQILCNKSAAESREHDIATRIMKEGSRVGDIVRGLLTFARERTEERKPIRVDDILAESLALTRSQMNKDGVILRIDVSPDLPKIVANAQQIQQVFMNVLSNARYALNQKYRGSAENKILDIRGEAVSEGGVPHVRLAFHDRGGGIPAQLLDRVMEPFFSTKPSGEGTGLGLSISHGIISDHGGRIAIESVEGEFTAVVISLPAGGSSNGDDSCH